MRLLCPDSTMAILPPGLELLASCLQVVSACSLPRHRKAPEDRESYQAVRCVLYIAMPSNRSRRRGTVGSGTATDVPSNREPSRCPDMSASSRCSTSRPSSFARIIMRSGCQTTSRVIPPSPLTSFRPVRALSESPFPDMTGSNMPPNSERLCQRPVAGEHPLAVAVAPDLRVPLRPALARGSVHERGRGFGELPAFYGPDRHQARLRLLRAFRRKRGTCGRRRQRRPGRPEALRTAGCPR